MLTHTEHSIAVCYAYTFRIMTSFFTGLDPADPGRLLIRKIVHFSEGQYAYEETRISKDASNP